MRGKYGFCLPGRNLSEGPKPQGAWTDWRPTLGGQVGPVGGGYLGGSPAPRGTLHGARLGQGWASGAPAPRARGGFKISGEPRVGFVLPSHFIYVSTPRDPVCCITPPPRPPPAGKGRVSEERAGLDGHFGGATRAEVAAEV